MKTAVVCFCTEDYKDQALTALYSFYMQRPNETYILKVLTDEIEYDVPKVNKLGKLNWCLQRFRIFDITGYDRVISIDSDLVAIGNIDYLFDEELNKYDACAALDYGAVHYYPDTTKHYKSNNIINAGVFIVNKQFLNNSFIDALPSLDSYNGSEQGYYTDYFYRNPDKKLGILPVKYNHCIDGFYPSPNDVRVVHYPGNQPLGLYWKVIDDLRKQDTIFVRKHTNFVQNEV